MKGEKNTVTPYLLADRPSTPELIRTRDNTVRPRWYTYSCVLRRWRLDVECVAPWDSHEPRYLRRRRRRRLRRRSLLSDDVCRHRRPVSVNRRRQNEHRTCCTAIKTLRASLVFHSDRRPLVSYGEEQIDKTSKKTIRIIIIED